MDHQEAFAVNAVALHFRDLLTVDKCTAALRSAQPKRSANHGGPSLIRKGINAGSGGGVRPVRVPTSGRSRAPRSPAQGRAKRPTGPPSRDASRGGTPVLDAALTSAG